MHSRTLYSNLRGINASRWQPSAFLFVSEPSRSAISLATPSALPVTPTQPAPFNQLHGGPQDTIQDLEEEEDVDFEAEEASQALQDVLEVTSDF